MPDLNAHPHTPDDLADHPRNPDRPLRILGIDPGLQITGYGIVDLQPNEIEPTLVEAGVFKFSSKKSIESRLLALHTDLTALITELNPHQLAIEKLFAHYKHPNTAIIMGHARGTILLAAKQHSLEIFHLAANEVKKSVTGYGHASKSQMQLAVQSQCNLPNLPEPPDVADAIAIALTHARRIAFDQVTSSR
ncbi:crossover junction endodeoxyribonuclease RuvC [Poriferisphaera corsica]|uniref:crossover junction endodeoxyribonuclease RuvC n=1 Tax=Poriferisphaera corsica TaxID=2528020 RepID=UPI0011A9753B|nr:crossover junction endodeoxyribonuclease RuvC [Poriferisphaera corsica]